MTLRTFTSAAGTFVLASLLSSNILVGADSNLSCIQEIAVPAASTFIASVIPATVQVTLTIGADGKAEGATYAAVGWLQFELQQAFVEKARYSAQCKGQRLTFEVRYEVAGEATAYPESVTRFLPPNKFVVICHPVKGTIN